MNGNVINGKDTVNAKLAECFVTIKGTRYNFAQMKNVTATMEKNKVEIGVLGKTGKANRSLGWKGTGDGTMHYNTSIFRELMAIYKDTGEDFYFDMQITNEDKTSSVGRQTVILLDCNLDSTILAKFDVDGEILDEDVKFTFEDWKLAEKFNVPSWM